MKLRLSFTSTQERRAATLAVLIVVLALAAFFFVIDVFTDLGEYGLGWHIALELLATVALFIGVALMMVELREMQQRMASLDRGIRAARGDMAGLIGSFFERWRLTPSEREVALLILKGFDNDAIAGIRGVAAGTIRAQSASIYAKAGVDGRAQLFSIFMEELLAEPDTTAPASGKD